MSEQNVIRFLEAVEGDQVLLDRCKAAPDLKVVISIAAEAGYEFTAEDVGTAGTLLRKASSDDELGDADLDRVVGGTQLSISTVGGLNDRHREIFGAPFYCFVPETMVTMFDGPDRAIAHVAVGDSVLAMNPKTGALEACAVETVHTHAAVRTSILELTVEGTEMPLRVTPNHPLWVEGSWVDAGELAIGAKLSVLNGNRIICRRLLSATRSDSAPKSVYDLTVATNHTFFANRVLAHNKVLSEMHGQ